MKSSPHAPSAIVASAPRVTGNTVEKDPFNPDAVRLANPAKRVGLREMVKAKLCTPQEGLAWLRKVDPNPNPTIVAWLEKKCKGIL